MECSRRGIGQRFCSFCEYFGALSILFAQTVLWMVRPPYKRRSLVEQMDKTGVNSAPIVFLTAFFSGVVLALQTSYTLRQMSAEIYVASLVSLSMCRELGPVFTALVVASRVGASITAEIGTMKVTEQIDALEVMAANPVKYLVVPRFAALVVMVPLLTVYADAVGMLGGMLVGVGNLNMPLFLYVKKTFDVLEYGDLYTGITKSAVFAAIIAVVACYEGMNTRGGAEGVGVATTRSVVHSCMLIFAANCLITALFYYLW